MGVRGDIYLSPLSLIYCDLQTSLGGIIFPKDQQSARADDLLGFLVVCKFMHLPDAPPFFNFASSSICQFAG